LEKKSENLEKATTSSNTDISWTKKGLGQAINEMAGMYL
jgi:hypothetical protein